MSNLLSQRTVCLTRYLERVKKQPNTRLVVLDATPHLMLSVHTGRNHVTTATVRLRNPADEVAFDLEKADVCQGSECAPQ